MKTNSCIFILMAMQFFCIMLHAQERTVAVKNTGEKIVKLGHGGMGIGNKYPINSLESILRCMHSGMDGFEIDVQMTADNQLIAFHDARLDRKTNISGVVNSLTLDEIKNARYKKFPFARYSVVSLHEIFTAIENLQSYTYVFDCKLYSANGHTQEYFNAFTNAIIEIADKYNIEQNILLESHNTIFLRMVKEKRPNMKLFIYPESFEKGLSIANELELYGITIASRNISKEQIALAHSKNIKVAIWNIHNRWQTKEAILKNPDYIQTDDIAALRKLL